MHKTTVALCSAFMVLFGAGLVFVSCYRLSEAVSTSAVAFLLLGLTSFSLGIWAWGKGEEHENDEE